MAVGEFDLQVISERVSLSAQFLEKFFVQGVIGLGSLFQLLFELFIFSSQAVDLNFQLLNLCYKLID